MGPININSRRTNQSIAFRAKYRVDPKNLQVMDPLLVAPHPKNRGGGPVKSLRTIQLNAAVTVEGFGPKEANCNAVAVQEKPAVAGEKGCVLGHVRFPSLGVQEHVQRRGV